MKRNRNWQRDDKRLRKAGYRIAARPVDGEPWWELGGVLYPEREALARLDWDEVKKEEGQVVS